jgi:drug/metabolite transporter (DMT)-like permease
MFNMKSNGGPLLIILAGMFWGTMGLFVRQLSSYGLTATHIACVRLFVAAVLFSGLLLIREPQGFKIRLKDLPLFLGLGWGSIGLMTCTYFMAIRMMSMSVAAILLYTSPIWVMLMSIVCFHEAVTKQKLIALVAAFAGCVLVSGIGTGNSTITIFGFLIGLCAGISYGLYSILGRIALRRYSTYVLTAYTFIFAFIGVFVISDPGEIAAIMATTTDLSGLLLLIVASGIITAFIPFLCYTLGLKTVEASRAAILATVEPLVATILGALVYHEAITPASGAGIVCILGAIVLLNWKKK